MASTHARSGAFHKDESDNDYDHSHEDTSDSNDEFASASEGDDDLPWEPVVIRSPAISRASPIVPSQTPLVSPSQTISRGTPKLRERMRQSPVPYSKIVQAYLDPTTQLQSPEHVRMAWLQDQQEARQDSSEDDEYTHESKIHTLQTYPITYQTRTQSQVQPQPIPVSQEHHFSTSATSQSVHAIAPHHNPPASSYLTTRTHTTDTIQTTEKTSSINVPAESDEGESGWGFDDEEIHEKMTENELEVHPESAEVITNQHPTETNDPVGYDAPTAISINLNEAIADDPEALWGIEEDISLPVESHMSPLAQDAIESQEDTYPHIHNIHETDGADDGWGYDDQGIEIAESAIQSEIAENAQEHTETTHTWNDTAGQVIPAEEEEDAWGNDLQEVNITGAPAEDVQVLAQAPIPTSVSATFGLAETELEVEEDAWSDDSQNIDIGVENLDTPNEAPQEEMLEDAWAENNDLDITTQDIIGNERLESFPVGTVQDSRQLKVTQRSSLTSEGKVDEASWGFDTDDITETPLNEHVQHSAGEQHHHSNLSTQNVSTHLHADGSNLTQQENATLSTSVESDIHFDNHSAMDSKGQAELVISGFDDIEENPGDAWGYDDPVVEAHEPIAEPTETAPADSVPLGPVHEVAQSSIEEAAQTNDVFEDHHHVARDHISNGSDNEHDNEVREVLLAAQTSSFIDMEGPESNLSTGPTSSRSSRHLDSEDQDVSVEHHVHHESSIYGNSLLNNATGEQSSEIKDLVDSDTGSDIYKDLSTARASMNASSNRLNEVLDDDDYLEHMERGVPMNRSISTPYSDDESPSKFIVEDELVELMERGERPLSGQPLAAPSEQPEESDEVDTRNDRLEHRTYGSDLATSFGTVLELATEDSTGVVSASETTTISTAILDAALTSSTEPEPVEATHSVALIDILSGVPEAQSIKTAEEHVNTGLLGGATSLEEAQLALEETLEEAVDSREEQHSDDMYGLAPSDLQHEADHQISLDVAIDEDDAWMDQDIQIAVDTTPLDDFAEVAESAKPPVAALDVEIVADGASSLLHGEVYVPESHSDIIVQEHSEQFRSTNFKVGSIVERSGPEQLDDIVEDAWGWDEQEVEVNLETQKETPSVQSEEQSSGESPSPGPSHAHDNEFTSDPIEALFEKSHEDIDFNHNDVHTRSENVLSAPPSSKPFDVDDFFKDLETPTVTMPASPGASHLVEDFLGESAEVQETLQLDGVTSLEPLPSSQEPAIPTTSIASPFKALVSEAEDQDYEDDGGAWDDESAWPDFAPKDVSENQLSGEEHSGLENHAVVEEFNKLDLTQQDHDSLEFENEAPTSILDVPEEESLVQEAEQWVDEVATVETTEHVLEHAHFHGDKDVEFQVPHNERAQEEHATTTDPWDEETDLEGVPVAEAETEPSLPADLYEAPIPFQGANDPVANEREGDAWKEDIEGLSKVSDISTAVMDDQPPVSSSSILSVLDDAIDDQAQGWGFDEDLVEEPIRDFKETVNSELSVPGASAPVANSMSPHDRLFSDDIHHLSTVTSQLESPLSSPAPVFESILASTTTSSFEHHVVHAEDRVDEEEDAWDNDIHVMEETTKAHVSIDVVEPEEDEKDAWGDNVDDASLEEPVMSQELITREHEEDSWDNGDAGLEDLEDLEEDLKAAVESQKAQPVEPEIAQAQEDILASSHTVLETALEVNNLMAGNIDISAEALDDGWGFDMDDAPQEHTSLTRDSEVADQSTPTHHDPVALPKAQEHPEVESPVTAQKEQLVTTAEHSEEEDGLSPWQDVSPQSVSKRSDAAMSLGSEFESEYSVRSMDDEERTSPALSHIHGRSIDSSSSAAGHSATKISTTMSWTDLNDDEWQDEDTDITQEMLHGTGAKTSASISNTGKMPSVEVQELPDLSGADSWDFDQDDLESESSSTYMDKTPLASRFDLSRQTKTPDMSEQRNVLQHKTSFTSVTPSPSRTFSSYQSSVAGSVPPSPARPAITPSMSSSSLSGNLAVDSSAGVEDDSHLPLAIRQQRARLAARGKPLPPISKYKSTKDQFTDKPALSETPSLSPRLSGATSPVISFTSPVGAASSVIPAATVSTDQKYLSPALQKQRERLEKKRTAAAATASAPLSAARRLTVGEQSQQAVKPPSPLVAKAVLPSALNKTVSPTIVKKVETTNFESLSSSTSA
ncbi:hypothetical protein BGZ82_010444, partial [Podila clonocystis]